MRDRRFIYRSYFGTNTSYSRSTMTVFSISVDATVASMVWPRTEISVEGHSLS